MGVAAGFVPASVGVRARGHESKVRLDRMSVAKGDKDVVSLSRGHLPPTDGPTRGEDVLIDPP